MCNRSRLKLKHSFGINFPYSRTPKLPYLREAASEKFSFFIIIILKSARVIGKKRFFSIKVKKPSRCHNPQKAWTFRGKRLNPEVLYQILSTLEFISVKSCLLVVTLRPLPLTFFMPFSPSQDRSLQVVGGLHTRACLLGARIRTDN